MVMPRCFSSGALSICSKATAWLAGSSGTRFASTLVMAAVSVVLPWSTWPMVPTFRCGFVLSNLPLAIILLLPLGYLGRDALGHLGIVIELHSERRTALRLAPDGRRVSEHLGERDHRPDELAATTGLPDEAALDVLDPPAHGLPVRHLRLADVRVHPKLAQQPVEDDLQVQLAHPGDYRLPRLLVAAHAEGRVLFSEALERYGQLLLVGLGLGLDSLVYDRLRKYHLLEHNRLAFGSDRRVAGPGLRETDRRHQLARVDFLALLPAVRVQLQEP